MLELTYSAHTVLPDGSTLLSVIETTTERRLFRNRTTSRATAYVHRGGFWWGERFERVTDNAKILRLCELVTAADARASVDAAVL